MRMLIAVFLTTVLAACVGATDAPPVPGPAPIPGVPSVELTEPWKSMNFPFDGAIVEESNPTSLVVRFPAIGAEDIGAVYAVVKQALLEAGWQPKFEGETADSRQLSLITPEGKKATLGMVIDVDRPLAQITVLP